MKLKFSKRINLIFGLHFNKKGRASSKFNKFIKKIKW